MQFDISSFNLQALIYSLILVIYAQLIIRYIFGWYNNFTFVEEENKIEDKIENKILASIVVSCRNEEQNIANLLDVLTAQDFAEKYEVIIIDDYSTDKTLKIAKAYAEKYVYVKIFTLKEGSGKKKALTLGIKKAKGEFLLTTDADCIMTKSWLSGFYEIYRMTGTKLISAIVLLEGNSYFEKLQQLEFLSLIASGAGSIGIEKGIMCNGANLGFSKDLFQHENPLNNSQVSGDDIFLLQRVKAQFGNKVLFSPNKNLIVRTAAKTNLKTFLNQRIRWASKSASYTDSDMIFSSWIVFLANLSIIIVFSLSIYSSKWLGLAFFLFVFKSIVDFLFLLITTKYLKQKKLLKFFIPLVVLYPIYIVFVAISSQFVSFEWKNRKFNL